MKIDMEQLRRLIREEYTQVRPGREGPLGRIAFSQKRLDDVPHDEADAPYEKRLYNVLSDYVAINKAISGPDASRIRGLIASGNYSKIFKAPTVETVFRGMNVTAAWIAAVTKSDKKSGVFRGPAVFVPRLGEASSWSVSYSAAREFVEGPNMMGVVLEARVSDNPGAFLDMNGGLYNVDPIVKWSREEEVLGLGKIKVSTVEWRDKYSW